MIPFKRMVIKQAILVGPKKIVFRERRLKKLKKKEILVKVAACGICSTEIPVYQGLTIKKPGASFRHAKYPCALGHEVVGIVISFGSAVTTFKKGDRVTGMAYFDSGFATHVIEPEESWVKIPEKVVIEHALGEPLAAVTNIVRLANPDFGDFVLIVGDGFMSLLAISILSKYPLKSLVVVGHHDNRLKLAKKFGATSIINSKNEDPYWAVRNLVDNKNKNMPVTPWLNGVDLAFDFTGKMAGLQLCASLCKPKKRARLVMAGVYGNEKFTLGEYLVNRGPILLPSYPAQSLNIMDDVKRAMWALEKGLFPMDKLITHAFSLSRLDDAMKFAISKDDNFIKGIVTPDIKMMESKKTYKILN